MKNKKFFRRGRAPLEIAKACSASISNGANEAAAGEAERAFKKQFRDSLI